jgi:hypothetical protein
VQAIGYVVSATRSAPAIIWRGSYVSMSVLAAAPLLVYSSNILGHVRALASPELYSMLMGERLKALASHDHNRAITIGGSTVSQDTGCTCNQAILAARQDELEAICGPSQKHQLSHRESELLPRFAEHYQQLKTLRRRMRRGLQRQWKRYLMHKASFFPAMRHYYRRHS